MFVQNVYFLLFMVVKYHECANILYSIPFTSKSHYHFLKPLGLELARRGHNVTVITPFKENDHPPNYHQVMVDDRQIWEISGIKRPNVFTMVDISAEEFHDKILWEGNLGCTENALNSTDLRKFLAADNKFDLVIAEQFFQEAFYYLSHKYQTPLVLITTYGNCMRHNIAVRNPLQQTTVISEFLNVKEPGTFLGTLRNWYFTLYEFFWWKYWFLPKQEGLAQKYIPNLPKPVPSLYEIQKNVSFILINGHFSFDSPAAYLPNVVEVGGLHLSKHDGVLPPDLKKIIDNSEHGVIYVNFGSNVQSSELPLGKRDAFLKVFGEINQTVIWKWEDDELKDMPQNVVVRKWLPQKEILAHPKIKVFISHGGLIGTQEAIFNGVPIVGIPIYADQYNNLLQAQDSGFGRVLPFHSINADTLREILNDVLNNDSYKNKAKEVSARFKDRPMTALDTAVFWVDYVIRHKGAEFMKNPARELSWVSYLMLDVYIFVVFVSFCIIYLIVKFLKFVLSVKVKNEKKKKH